jgi:acylphosphatase
MSYSPLAPETTFARLYHFLSRASGIRTKTEESDMRITRHLRITGRVQGVGYRDALRREALSQGLSGWVRNRSDGSVEAVLQGEEQAVLAVAAWARRGPPAARVAAVGVEPAAWDLDRDYPGFDWLPTE